MKKRLLVLLLLSSQVAEADSNWSVIPSLSAQFESFRYIDPDTAEPFLINIGVLPYLSGNFTVTDPTERSDGLWEAISTASETVLTNFVSTFRFTQTSNSSLVFDPTRSTPDFFVLGASNLEIFDVTDTGFTTPLFAGASQGGLSGLSFTLFNAPGYRDPAAAPSNPVVAQNLQLLGAPSIAEILDLAQHRPELPTDWTALGFSAAAFPGGDAVFTAAQLASSFAMPLDPAGVVGATDNGDGTFAVPLEFLLGVVAYTTGGFPGFIDTTPIGSVLNPMLPGTPDETFIPSPIGGVVDVGGQPLPTPVIGEPFVFTFVNGATTTVTFFDPEVATGYTYELLSEGAITGVLLPDIGDGIYDLFLFDALAEQFFDTGTDLNAGELFAFVLGTQRFMIQGIEESAGLDPNDPLAFVTGLQFDRVGELQVVQTPLVTTVVPLPGALVLLVSGMGLLAARGRRMHV